MTGHRSFALAGALVLALTACAQNPGARRGPDHAAHHPSRAAGASAPSAEQMAMMDAQMKAMREMHERMAGARTPEERQALMAEHHALMQRGMAMMDGMGSGAMGGMGGMGGGAGRSGGMGGTHGGPGGGPGMHGMGPMGAASAPMDMAACHPMMERRLQMMQSMMQMMMDRMGAPAARP